MLHKRRLAVDAFHARCLSCAVHCTGALCMGSALLLLVLQRGLLVALGLARMAHGLPAPELAIPAGLLPGRPAIAQGKPLSDLARRLRLWPELALPARLSGGLPRRPAIAYGKALLEPTLGLRLRMPPGPVPRVHALPAPPAAPTASAP